MAKFKCEMQMPDGQVKYHTITAPSLAEATQIAQSREGYLLNIIADGSQQNLYQRMQNVRVEFGPGLRDLMSFTKQLSVMIKAGISIRDAIASIADGTPNMRFQATLNEVCRDVESGIPFSGALGKHPKVFSSLYVNMIRASEISGTFAHMLDRIVEYLDQQDETHRMVRGAMIYPIVLFTMSIAAVVFLLQWVVPKFMKLFKGKEHLLPKPTIILLAMSNFMQNYWYIPLSIVVVLATGIIITVRTPTGRRAWDRMLLAIPIIKKMMRALYITRSLQSLGELVNAGVPILEALDITAEISGNCVYKDMWRDVRDTVKEGGKIVHELQASDNLPRSVVQMISAGEESGRLGEVLDEISRYYSKELKETIKTVTGLLEPLMIVFMGVVVGFIAMSILLPIFSMQKLMGK
ncbi:MAG: type II secretion system F family protein [Phycisphaerae bacterium]|nr:type II secretion system F family protein [Phycisphaerae bacterium]